jgi:hypothetical protein
VGGQERTLVLKDHEINSISGDGSGERIVNFNNWKTTVCNLSNKFSEVVATSF